MTLVVRLEKIMLVIRLVALIPGLPPAGRRRGAT